MMKAQIMREHAKSLIYATIVFLLLYIFLWPVRIIGVSMEPVLNDDDRVFVSRAMVWVGAYERNDLVMTRIDGEVRQRFIIKRIVAVPGDVIVIENGQLSVNNELIAVDVYGSVSIVLDYNHYFLMGDNHAYSNDSRDFGSVHSRDIRGRVLFRFFGGRFNIY